MIKFEDIEMIIFNGYYVKDEEGIEPFPHTKETLELYEKGLEVAQEKFGLENDGDIYEGVIFENGEPLAQCSLENSDKLVDYVEIK